MASLKKFLFTAALVLTPSNAAFDTPPESHDFSIRETSSDEATEILVREIRGLLENVNEVQDLKTREEVGLASILARADQGTLEELLLRGLHSRNRATAAEERLKKLPKPTGNLKPQLAAQKKKTKEETIKAASKHRPRSLRLRDRKKDAEERLKKLPKPTGNLKPQLAAQKKKTKEETIEAASKHNPRSLYLRDRKSDAEARLKKLPKPTGNLKPQLAAQKKKTKEETIKAASKKQ